MSRLVVFLGLLCGFLFGVAVLVLNPWTPPADVAGARANTYDWVPLESYGVSLDEAALLNLPLQDSGAELGANLATANAAIIVLRGAGGEAVALGTRLSAVDESSDMLSGDVGIKTYTNLYWPNRGSVLLHGRENRWPVIRSSMLELVGREAPVEWAVTTPRLNDIPSGAVGGSGTLESVGGRYTETLRLSSSGDGSYAGEIALELSLR